MEKRMRDCFYARIIGDGESEILYFKRLAELINNTKERCCNIKFEYSKEKNLPKLAKNQQTIVSEPWFYITDKETSKQEDQVAFLNKLQNCKKVRTLNKNINLHLGYSNASIELWLLLHKIEFNKPVHSAQDYWSDIQNAYALRDVDSFRAYKEGDTFNRRVLAQITLEDVKSAIARAERIEAKLLDIEEPRHDFGFDYFNSTPSLSVHRVVRLVLESVGLL